MGRTWITLSMLLCLVAAASPAVAAGPPTLEHRAMTIGLDDAVRAARAAAARHTGLAPEVHTLVGAASVTWPDGSLGCPERDMMYTQALVPGYRVRLRGPDGELDVHLDARGHAVLCPAHRARKPVPGADRATS